MFINTTFRKRKNSFSDCNDQMRLRSLEDQKLAKNILILLTANIICWGPVVSFCTYSVISSNPMNRSYIKIIAIFVIPFNSLINPFLYCITRNNFRIYINNFLLRYRLRRDIENNVSLKSTYSLKSIFNQRPSLKSFHKNSLITSVHRNSEIK